jgi:hypothetical protein
MANGTGGGGGSAEGIRAGRAFVELGTHDKDLFAGLDRAAAAVKGFGSKVAAGGFGLIGLGSSVLAPLGAAFLETVHHLRELGDAAERLSTTPAILSALGYAAEQTGASMEDLEAGTKNLYKSIAASGRPAGELADEYKRLADELAGIEDPARRSARAVELLGRNGLALLPMLSKGGEDLQRRLDRAAKVRGMPTEEEVAQAAKVGEAIDDVWQSLKRIPGAVASALLPFADAIEAAADKAVDLLAAVKAFIRANALVIIGVTAAAAAVVALGGAVVVLGSVITAAGVVLEVLAGVLAFAVSPAGILLGIFVGLAAAMVYLAVTTEEGKAALRPFVEAWGELADVFGTTYGGILDALMGGDLELAGEIAMAGLTAVWKLGLVKMQSAWDDFKHFFLDGWKSARLLFELNLNDAVAFFAQAWIKVLKLVNKNFHETFTAVLKGMAGIADVFGDKDLGGALRTLAGLQKGQADAVLDAASKLIEKKRSAEEDRLNKAAGIGTAVGKSPELIAAEAELAKALRDLAELRDRAADLDPAGKDRAKNLGEVINPGMTRGTFATRGYGAQAFGDATMAGRQVKAAEKVPPLLEKIDGKLGDLLNLGPLTLGV